MVAAAVTVVVVVVAAGTEPAYRGDRRTLEALRVETHASSSAVAPARGTTTRAEGQAALLEVIVEGQKTGVLRAGDPMQLALAWASMMHGLSVLPIEGQLCRYDRPVDAAKLASVVSHLLFEGLASRMLDRLGRFAVLLSS